MKIRVWFLNERDEVANMTMDIKQNNGETAHDTFASTVVDIRINGFTLAGGLTWVPQHRVLMVTLV